jgi:hypothetical protein
MQLPVRGSGDSKLAGDQRQSLQELSLRSFYLAAFTLVTERWAMSYPQAPEHNTTWRETASAVTALIA